LTYRQGSELSVGEYYAGGDNLGPNCYKNNLAFALLDDALNQVNTLNVKALTPVWIHRAICLPETDYRCHQI